MNGDKKYVCLECQSEIEHDDNFCHNCGYWTARGYKYFKDAKNQDILTNGIVTKQSNKLKTLINLLSIFIIIFAISLITRSSSILRPIVYLKKQAFTLVNGYKASSLKTANTYSQKEVLDLDEANYLIKQDFEKQDYLCKTDLEVRKIEYNLENNYKIPSINFCDIDLNESNKISNVIERMYKLFPNIKGALSNITITNAPSKEEYIAYFQSKFAFINSNEDINSYNKVNKTQILLNSYYFLNKNIISKPISSVVKNNYYVQDATWESTIAHELGHYISFKLLLKENNLENITFVTKDNEEKINKVIDAYNNETFAKNIIYEALINYNLNYNENKTLTEFAKSISNYASTLNNEGNIITEETLAEAIHDYYLHEESSCKESLEIIKIVKAKLSEG